MNIDALSFYEDDEGVAVDIVLDVFSNEEIQVIYLESSLVDEKFNRDIEFIIKNRKEFYNLASAEIISYTEKFYKNKSSDFKLIIIYVFPDVENEFGFVFNWSGDVEHGVGIKFNGTSIKKIGSGETAFL